MLIRFGFFPFWLFMAGLVLFPVAPGKVAAQGTKEGAKPTIAVWDFTLNQVQENDGQALTNRLRSELVNSRKFRVMTRDQIQTLLGEQALGQTLIDAKEAIKAGKLRGVKYVVTGTMISLRGALQVTVEMIDGETAEIIQSITPRTYRGGFLDFLDEEVPALSNRLIGVAAGGKKAERELAQTPPPPPIQEREPPQRFAEREPERARPSRSTSSGPRLGLGGYLGFATYSVTPSNGGGYTSSGLNVGLDYQVPLSPALSLNLMWMTTLEGYSGETALYFDDTGFASHQIIAGQVRVWLGPLFVGGQAGLYTENLTSDSQPFASSSGFGIGGVVGFEASGFILSAQMDFGFLSTDDSQAIPVDTFGLTFNLGFRL